MADVSVNTDGAAVLARHLRRNPDVIAATEGRIYVGPPGGIADRHKPDPEWPEKCDYCWTMNDRADAEPVDWPCDAAKLHILLASHLHGAGCTCPYAVDPDDLCEADEAYQRLSTGEAPGLSEILLARNELHREEPTERRPRGYWPEPRGSL